MSDDRPDETRLMALASFVDEQQPIDWQAAEAQARDKEERAIVSELRVLANVARVSCDPDGELTMTPLADRRGGPAQPLPFTSWGSLTILEVVGSGAFGTVFRARDNLNREVALKLLMLGEPTSVQGARVLHEGRVLARVRHPNVVVVHGADKFEGHVGLWMEFIKGRTLEEELRTRGVSSAQEARLIGLDLCRALAAVHAAGLLHRDIKAQNVMREAGGRIVLMDFGTGRDSGWDDIPGVEMAGTPLYLAPEVFSGQSAGPTSDIYSLGVLLYHLVSGRYPVEGSNRSEIERAHREQRRTRLRDVRADLPEGFVQVVERALTSDPAQRYQTAGELEEALASVCGVPQEKGQHSDPRPRTPRMASRHPLIMAACVAGIAILGVWLATSRHRPPPAAGDTLTASSDSSKPAPSTPIVAADAPYTIGATFYRVTGGETIRLSADDHIAPGDQLDLTVNASRSVYVYVVNEDERGESYLLFPLPEQEPSNPLQSGRVHRLPGRQAGRDVHWQVTSAGGREHFLVFVSPTHLPIFDAMLEALPYAKAGRPVLGARMPEPLVARLRGVGGLASSDSTSKATLPRHLFEMASALRLEPETTRGVWVRQMTLENPGK